MSVDPGTFFLRLLVRVRVMIYGANLKKFLSTGLMDAKLPLVLISLVFLLEIESSLILARHIASLTANCVL